MQAILYDIENKKSWNSMKAILYDMENKKVITPGKQHKNNIIVLNVFSEQKWENVVLAATCQSRWYIRYLEGQGQKAW